MYRCIINDINWVLNSSEYNENSKIAKLKFMLKSVASKPLITRVMKYGRYSKTLSL